MQVETQQGCWGRPPSLSRCVTLGKLLALSDPQALPLQVEPTTPALSHHSLAVCGELEVVGAHLEEVEEVRAAGDLDRQAHERAAVLGKSALAALGHLLPIKPPRGWRDQGRTPEDQ